MICMKGYKTSKDYKRLKELLDSGHSVICFVPFNNRRWHFKDKDNSIYATIDENPGICIAQLNDKGSKWEYYSLECYGKQYIHFYTKHTKDDCTFEGMLESNNVEFIEPDDIIQSL